MIKTKKAKIVNIGLVGLGTVGTGVVKVLRARSGEIERRTGIRLCLKKVCVRSSSKRRAVKLPRAFVTENVDAILRDHSIDIVVELIGGIHPAKEIILKSLAAGKHVVTANKALLAEQGASLYHAAAKTGGKLGIEASVCGGIPIIKSLKEGLASNEINHFLGIVNGTCNFILTAMSQGTMDFREALKEAQAQGYAEANPKLDIDGTDSAHKLAILARLAFRSEIPFKSISVEGIKNLQASDIAFAKELGYGIKLLALGKKTKHGLELRVHPTLLPLDHPLISVRGVYNAVFIHGDQTGDLLFYGRGAGMFPTASAVMSDIIDTAKRLSGQKEMRAAKPHALSHLRVLPMDEIRSKYYLRFQVADEPGVLGRIAQMLGQNGISILSVHQKESHDPTSVPVIILTYEASEKNLKRALKAIDSKKFVSEKTVVIRVES